MSLKIDRIEQDLTEARKVVEVQEQTGTATYAVRSTVTSLEMDLRRAKANDDIDAATAKTTCSCGKGQLHQTDGWLVDVHSGHMVFETCRVFGEKCATERTWFRSYEQAMEILVELEKVAVVQRERVQDTESRITDLSRKGVAPVHRGDHEYLPLFGEYHGFKDY